MPETSYVPVLRLRGRVFTREAVRFTRVTLSKKDWKSLSASLRRVSERVSVRESVLDVEREVLALETWALSVEGISLFPDSLLADC